MSLKGTIKEIIFSETRLTEEDGNGESKPPDYIRAFTVRYVEEVEEDVGETQQLSVVLMRGGTVPVKVVGLNENGAVVYGKPFYNIPKGAIKYEHSARPFDPLDRPSITLIHDAVDNSDSKNPTTLRTCWTIVLWPSDEDRPDWTCLIKVG